MKKVLLVVALGVSVLLTGCGDNKPTKKKGGKSHTVAANDSTDCKNSIMVLAHAAEDESKVANVMYPDGKSKSPGSLPWSAVIVYKSGKRTELDCAGKYLTITNFKAQVR